MPMVADLKRLRAFAVIAETRSFTRAAQQLGVAQPWLSIQIRGLEDGLGMKLFERTKGKPIALTEHGAMLLPFAQEAVTGFDRFGQAAKSITEAGKGRLTIGTDPFTLHMPERIYLLENFRKSHPQIALNIVNFPPNVLYEKLVSGEIDVAISIMPAPAGIMTTQLCSYELALCLPRESPLAKDKEIALEQLSGQRILTTGAVASPELRKRHLAYFARHGIAMEECPEPGYAATVRYAQLARVPYVTLTFPSDFHEIPADMVLRPIAPPRAAVEWCVARMPDLQNRAAERFWRSAQAAHATGNAAPA